MPRVIVTDLASRRGAQVVDEASYRRLRLMARVTAARIDQFLDDYRVTLRALRRAPTVLAAPEGDARSLAAGDLERFREGVAFHDDVTVVVMKLV